MSRCPLTYDECGEARYSAKGLRRLSPRLRDLEVFPYSVERQREEALARAGRMSVQGVQPKLSVRLSVARQAFELVDRDGRFIVKPQNPPFPEVPENEDATMRLGAAVGIETPLHGLLPCADGSYSYFIKRFDREGRGRKLAVEDLAQLAGRTRETKYDYSVERLFRLLEHCTFPAVARVELWGRLLFGFLVGNEDMHLKNFSLITRGGRVELAPAYDFLSTTILYHAMGRPGGEIEETALPLEGRRKGLGRRHWVDALARERLGLPPAVVERVLRRLAAALPEWNRILEASFLSEPARQRYQELIASRASRLGL